MLQFAIALVVILMVTAIVLWWFILYKLLPLYRKRAVQDGYRTAFQVAVVLLSWVTMQIIVWLLLVQDALAMMLNVVWVVGLLAWLTLSTVARTRRQMLSETAAAQAPRPQPVPQPVQQAKQPDISRYTVRKAPRATAAHAGAPRSSRVRRIQAMGENYGD